MTLEEAQAEIVRLTEELNTARADNENYSAQVTSLNADLEKVRTINQQYFLKLQAQNVPPATEGDDEPPKTCEEFALTLTI